MVKPNCPAPSDHPFMISAAESWERFRRNNLAPDTPPEMVVQVKWVFYAGLADAAHLIHLSIHAGSEAEVCQWLSRFQDEAEAEYVRLVDAVNAIKRKNA